MYTSFSSNEMAPFPGVITHLGLHGINCLVGNDVPFEPIEDPCLIAHLSSLQAEAIELCTKYINPVRIILQFDVDEAVIFGLQMGSNVAS